MHLKPQQKLYAALLLGGSVVFLILLLLYILLQTTDDETLLDTPLTNDAHIMAWVYPGEPGCEASDEYRDGRHIDVLKPEYFTVLDTGTLIFLTEENAGCNGFSEDNVRDIKAHSNEQFVTVSGEPAGMRALFATAESKRSTIETLLTFVEDHDFTGAEIDFEGYSSWRNEDYDAYKNFLTLLGDALHAGGRKLMIDVPPISNNTEQDYYLLTYEDMATLPVDYMVIMTYDYQFNHGAGAPIAPNDWVLNTIARAQAAFEDHKRIVIGIPSYGYQGMTGSYEVIRTGFDTLAATHHADQARRDPDSYELIWEENGVSYVKIDAEGLDLKRALIVEAGITNISVWALGGNAWFSQGEE